MKEFQAKAEKEFASFSQFVPTKETSQGKQRLRAHYVNPSICKDISCSDGCNDCQNAAIECAKKSGLSGIANKIIAITKNSLVTYDNNKQVRLCGCAGGIPSLTSISLDSYSCEQTVSHEVGHSLGLYHIACEGSEAGACLGPNAVDCKDSNKNTDIMSYCHPRDHYGPAAYNFLKSNVFSNYLGG